MAKNRILRDKGPFRRAYHICEDSAERPGSLAKLNGGTGFYSFLRLIGAVYFHAHRPGFPEHTSPESLYNSLQHSGRTAEEVHTEFIETIRTAIWERIVFEDHLLPSTDALKRHYLRATWTTTYWKQTPQNNVYLPPILECGWKLEENKLTVDWESDKNRKAVRDRVLFLMKGCTCKKSKCSSNICSCHKNNRLCGPGCSCIGCHNNKHSQGKIFMGTLSCL